MIKAVLIDLDDTILDFKMSERAALTRTLIDLGIEPDDEIISAYSKFNISQWKRLELGEITRDEVKVNRYRLLFDAFGIDAAPEEATPIYEGYLASEHYLIDGAVDMLEELYGDYDLYIASNGTRSVQDSRLNGAGIKRYFKDTFISEVVGYEKPSTEFFKHCHEKMGNPDKSQLVIIGDSLSSDIKGGRNFGIRTIWFNKNHEASDDIKPDYEISSLSEAVALLKKL